MVTQKTGIVSIWVAVVLLISSTGLVLPIGQEAINTSLCFDRDFKEASNVATGSNLHSATEPIDSGTRTGSNLLQNSGFEEDTDSNGVPDHWEPFTPMASDATFEWNSSVYHTGGHSVSIESTSEGMAMWQQFVDVVGDTMYTFAGHSKLEVVNGECKLELVWRDSVNNIISFFNLPPHRDTIDWIYDNPHEVFVRSPSNAVKVEVNCLLRDAGKVWFDDIYFGLTPTGTISGTVTCDGTPVAGVHVYVLGTPEGIKYEDWTDSNGDYDIEKVPVASPRYILVANKTGYVDAQEGDIAVVPGVTVDVDFQLKLGANLPRRELTIKFVQFGKEEDSPIVEVSPHAVINPSLYPEWVLPYLAPSEYLESDDPAIVSLANEILATIDPANRTNLSQVAYAVYLWHIKNIEFDGYTDIYPYDVTSGSWQTISYGAGEGNGWSWGHNFTDWLYTATEILEQRRGICIEHSRLPAAILRALDIPARPVTGYGTQYWCQLPSGEGYWVYMCGVGGRGAYRTSGNLWAGFTGGPAGGHKIWRPDAHPPVHSDWYTENKCAWREVHPWGNRYENTEAGYDQAVADLETFAETGELPPRFGAVAGPCYNLEYADFTLNLTNIGDQKLFRARFPINVETAYTHHLDCAYWTNMPDLVTRTWIENITNPPAVDVLRYFNIEFDFTNLTPVEVDTTPPEIAAIHPPAGAENVSVDTSIYVVFNEPMDETVDISNIFQLTPSVNGTATWINGDLYFTPAARLEYDTTYNVTLGAGLMDLAGNPFPAGYSWEFTTEWNITLPENLPPRITEVTPVNRTITMFENETVNFTVTASDEDVLNLTYAWKLDGNIILDWSVSYYEYYADFTSAGNHTLNVTVTDSGKPPLSAYFEWDITVLNVNRAPVIEAYFPVGNPTINDTTSITFSISAYDLDIDDELGYRWYISDRLIEGISNNSYTYTPEKGERGTYIIRVEVYDDKGGVASHEWELTVLPTEVEEEVPRAIKAVDWWWLVIAIIVVVIVVLIAGLMFKRKRRSVGAEGTDKVEPDVDWES